MSSLPCCFGFGMLAVAPVSRDLFRFARCRIARVRTRTLAHDSISRAPRLRFWCHHLSSFLVCVCCVFVCACSHASGRCCYSRSLFFFFVCKPVQRRAIKDFILIYTFSSLYTLFKFFFTVFCFVFLWMIATIQMTAITAASAALTIYVRLSISPYLTLLSIVLSRANTHIHCVCNFLRVIDNEI